MGRWELVEDGDGFLLLRNRARITRLGGTREWAQKQLEEYRDQERRAREALATGDPLAVCRIGWHRGPLPTPIADTFRAPTQYFRFRAKIGEAGGTLIYSVADEPLQYLARTVKCLGMLTPWVCATCGQSIGTNAAT